MLRTGCKTRYFFAFVICCTNAVSSDAQTLPPVPTPSELLDCLPILEFESSTLFCAPISAKSPAVPPFEEIAIAKSVVLPSTTGADDAPLRRPEIRTVSGGDFAVVSIGCVTTVTSGGVKDTIADDQNANQMSTKAERSYELGFPISDPRTPDLVSLALQASAQGETQQSVVDLAPFDFVCRGLSQHRPTPEPLATPPREPTNGGTYAPTPTSVATANASATHVPTVKITVPSFPVTRAPISVTTAPPPTKQVPIPTAVFTARTTVTATRTPYSTATSKPTFSTPLGPTAIPATAVPVIESPKAQPQPFHFIFATGPFKPGELKSPDNADAICNAVAERNGLEKSGWKAILYGADALLRRVTAQADVFNVHCDHDSSPGRCVKPLTPNEEMFVSERTVFNRGGIVAGIRDVTGREIDPQRSTYLVALTGIQPTDARDSTRLDCQSWSSSSSSDVGYYGNVRDPTQWDLALDNRSFQPLKAPCDKLEGHIYCIDEQVPQHLLKLDYVLTENLLSHLIPDFDQTYSDMTVTITSPSRRVKTLTIKRGQNGYSSVMPGSTIKASVKITLPTDPIGRQVAREQFQMPYCVTRASGNGTELIDAVAEADGFVASSVLRAESKSAELQTGTNEVEVTCELSPQTSGQSLIVAQITRDVDVVVSNGDEVDLAPTYFTRGEPSVTREDGQSVPASSIVFPPSENEVEQALAAVHDAKLALLASNNIPLAFKPGEGPGPTSCPTFYRHATMSELRLQGPDKFKVRALGLAAIAIRFGDDYVRNLIADDLRKPIAEQQQVVSFVRSNEFGEQQRPLPGAETSTFPVSYDGNSYSGKIGTMWKVCFSMAPDARFTYANLEKIFHSMIDLEPDLKNIKNLDTCNAVLRSELGDTTAPGGGRFDQLEKLEIGRDYRRFLLNLAIEFYEGTCQEGMTALIPPDRLVLSHGGLSPNGNEELTGEEFTDHFANGQIGVADYLRSRFTLYFLRQMDAVFRTDLRNISDPLEQRLRQISRPSIEYTNVFRSARAPFTCKGSKNELGTLAYYWCRYNTAISMIPVAGLVHDGIVFIGDVATGTKPTGEPATPILDASMGLVQGIPVIGQFMKGGKRSYDSFRAASWAGSREVAQYTEQVLAKGIQTIRADGDEAAWLYRSLMQRATMPTAAEMLPNEVSALQKVYGPLQRGLGDRIIDPAFAMGPQFHLASNMATTGVLQVNQRIPPHFVAMIEKEAGVVLREVPNTAPLAGLEVKYLYEIRGNMNTFIGRKTAQLEQLGFKFFFSPVQGIGETRPLLRELIVPFFANYRLALARSWKEAHAAIAFRHEIQHVWVQKLLAKGRVSALMGRIRGLLIHDVPFKRTGLQGYGANASIDELRAMGVTALGALRYCGLKKTSEAQRRLALTDAQATLEMLGNLMHSKRAALLAEGQGSPQLLTLDIWQKLGKDLTVAGRQRQFGDLAPSAEVFFKENPAVVLAVSSAGKGNLIVPVGFHRGANGLAPNIAEATSAYNVMLARTNEHLNRAIAEFEKMVPLLPAGSKPPAGKLFYRVEEIVDGRRSEVIKVSSEALSPTPLVGTEAGPSAYAAAQRQLRAIMREIGTLIPG
jgi:hypothetical protein